MRAVSARGQRGLSIIELMIALLLGLLLMGGVLQLFLSSKRTYQTNAALSQVQESGRFALEFLAFDLRNAAYRGECMSPLDESLLPASLAKPNGQTDIRYDLGAGIQGWSTASNEQNPAKTPSWLTATFNDRANGSDVILLKHAADPATAQIASATVTQISTDRATGMAQNRLLVIDDPGACFLFANQSGPTDSNVSVSGSTGFGRIYRNTAHLLLYQSALYYLQNNPNTGVPSLWRQVYNGLSQPAEELVSGIQQLQIRYAVGDATGQISLDANGQAYQDASTITDWQSVIAARISLIAVSSATNVVSPNQQVFFNNTSTTIPNGRLAQVFTLTVTLRNHLP
ncbi:hypothetical protein NS201_14245 [Pseudomonas oryzihabitans]|nr:hypothetical protein NS201_14245 [Pseudomonas psychrotolerans]